MRVCLHACVCVCVTCCSISSVEDNFCRCSSRELSRSRIFSPCASTWSVRTLTWTDTQWLKMTKSAKVLEFRERIYVIFLFLTLVYNTFTGHKKENLAIKYKHIKYARSYWQPNFRCKFNYMTLKHTHTHTDHIAHVHNSTHIHTYTEQAFAQEFKHTFATISQQPIADITCLLHWKKISCNVSTRPKIQIVKKQRHVCDSL